MSAVPTHQHERSPAPQGPAIEIGDKYAEKSAQHAKVAHKIEALSFMRNTRDSSRRPPQTTPRKKRRVHLHVAAIGLLFAGFGAPKILNHIRTQKAISSIVISGDKNLPIVTSRVRTQSLSPEIKTLTPPDCGPAKPTHAPVECGLQQWKGYSETNPAAAVWMALVNTSNKRCTVTVTRLTMSYLSGETRFSNGTRTVLSSNINGVQLLTDGTDTGAWGNYIQDLPPGATFSIPANLHAYIHPFGPIVAIPEKATEVTITMAAEISDGCAISGGIDTFEENDIPNTNPPYTKDGSVTDFIKEALKTPWITESISPNHPVSYSITHLPREMRTGWYKGRDEN